MAKVATDSDSALKEHSKILKTLNEDTSDPNKLQTAAEEADVQLSCFRSGALATFKELVTLARPAEPEGAQPSPDCVASAAEAQPSPDGVESVAEGGGTEAEAEGTDAKDGQEEAEEGEGENADEEVGEDNE